MKIDNQESCEYWFSLISIYCYRYTLIIYNFSTFISIAAKKHNAQEICFVLDESKRIQRKFELFEPIFSLWLTTSCHMLHIKLFFFHYNTLLLYYT